ncbi:hypothetical protein [Aquihabitans sp. McL0605]|uniref:hypothetical protein n=1 Tax=Aquihabitans sp. McL0605 TaxID=3415671 RepID=UPI003CF8E128
MVTTPTLGVDDDAARAAVDETATRVYAGYFALQAVAGIGFWVAVAAVPAIRKVFEMSTRQHAVTDSFLFADIAIGIIGSAVASAGIVSKRRWGSAVALFVAGGMVYATIYLVGWVAFTGKGAGLLGLMVVPSTLSVFVAVSAWRLHR